MRADGFSLAKTRSDLDQGVREGAVQTCNMWQSVITAPFDRDLELAVVDEDGPHALVFPCRRIVNGWMNAKTRELLDVHPTHWRPWPQGH